MKERLGQEIKYDIKSLGFNFWVPPLVTVRVCIPASAL